MRAARKLYHQYKGKAALFLDVFEHVERDLTAELVERVAGLEDPIEMLRISGEAFLYRCLQQELRQTDGTKPVSDRSLVVAA